MLTAGTNLGPYEIVSVLGAGGMGEVYCARDPRLGRDVAIKVLPAEFASDPDRSRRFEHEARAVAVLDHPNILAIHDVGSACVSLRGAGGSEAISAPASGLPRPLRGLAVTEGAGQVVHYLVTELLEGEALRERLEGEGLTIRKAVDIGIQIAKGLAAAHGKGIVHRDLKPSNLFLTTDGQVKLLDFGLAKLTRPEPAPGASAEASVSSTETGAVMGTVGYMSPEQVRGVATDHRTDILSFGCVLHEMISGKRPFRGDTTSDVMAAILKEDAAPLSVSVPPVLKSIVRRCLEKRLEDRFDSAHDLALALQAFEEVRSRGLLAMATSTKRRRFVGLGLAGIVVLAAAGVLVLRLTTPGRGARATGPPKIVVLPFENLGSQEDTYFATGMTEEITSRLANVKGLGVISRTSAMQYDRRGKTVKQIGSDLGVDYVLEGSVRWERGAGCESRVRITPQLIRVADDTHVWADRYDRVIADVFAIQSEVAENAVKAMGVPLLPRERSAMKAFSTDDLEAYDLYLRGLDLFNASGKRADLEGAVRMFQAAVDRDPRFAQALAGLAESHVQMYRVYDRSQERLVRAKEAAQRAVEFRPDLAETHSALGWYFYQGLRDYPRALEEFAAALKIQPNNCDGLWGIGAVLRRQGRWMEAAEAMGKALEWDPKNAKLLTDFGISCMYARRYDDADRALLRALNLNPQWASVYAVRARVQLLWHGDVDKAQAILGEVGQVAGLADEGELVGPRLWVALARGDYPGALRQLDAETCGPTEPGADCSLIQLLLGQVQRLAGQDDLARRAFEAARLDLEQRVRRYPDNEWLHSLLGMAYAGLGRSMDAVREARLGCELMPASKDAMRAHHHVEELARVYTMVGRKDEAIVQLDDLLARSGLWTPHLLRLDPRWDPLRSDPRFQALLTKYEVRE